MRTRPTMRLRHAGLLATVALTALAALPAYAGAAPAAPRWQITLSAFPTTLVPGSTPKYTGANAIPQYNVVFTNIGAGTASGPIRITETLPSGISVPASTQAEVSPSEECETPSPAEVVCEIERTVGSGEDLVLSVPLEVAPSAPSPALTRVEIAGGGAMPASSTLTSEVGSTPAPYGFVQGPHGMSAVAAAEDGLDAGQAGSHPYSVILENNFDNLKAFGLPYPVEDLKDLELRLPHGFTVDPQAMTERCTEEELASLADTDHGVGGCGRASQIGQVTVETLLSGVKPLRFPLYAMEPPSGVAAELGFNVLGTLIHIQGGLDGSFHLTGGSSDVLAKYSLLGIKAELWGDPANSHHDPVRRGNDGCGTLDEGCSLTPAEANNAPFLTMPTSCGDPLSLGATATSWEGSVAGRETTFTDLEGGPLAMAGCNALAFEPTIESKATTNAAESPAGLDFRIHQPQDESIEGRSTARLKDVKVTLPEGMSLNPSAANGLEACTLTQMGYAPEGPKVQFTTEPQHCPPASKVGTLTVKTPLLDHELPGAVYVAKPYSNPFGSMLAIYLAIEDEASGIIAKLAGKVQPDPRTGQLSASFAENPDLPLEDIKVHFFEGAHGALTTPLTCGPHTTLATLTPWSTPQGATVSPTDAFQTSVGCAASEAAAPKDAGFIAQTQSPLAGAYSPFALRISRPDGSQHITGMETTLPAGLTGKLAGIPYCPEPAIARAVGREVPEAGRLEQLYPSCPQASEVGKVTVTAGSGPDPLPVSGHAYLAGPYKGAPLSMVAIVPAVAGPFDLGTVVDRVALYVGEYDARIHAVADPLPTIRQGIPLDVRSIELRLDRPGFTLNPTSCEAKAIEGQVTTQAGQSQALSNRFQVGECGRLKFKPKIQISLKGGTKKTGHPALKAVVTYPKGGSYANLAKAQVSLPHSEFLDQGNLNKVCTQPQLKSKTCPAKAIYGKVKVWTPLFEKPLEGNVYLGVGYGYKLPALVAELDGQVRVLVAGKVDTTKQHGIRNTFETVPDAPLEKFVLQMKGGKKYGLLENSEDICKKKQVATAAFTAQNGKVLKLTPRIANSCGKKKARHKKHDSKHRRAKAGTGARGSGRGVNPGPGGKVRKVMATRRLLWICSTAVALTLTFSATAAAAPPQILSTSVSVVTAETAALSASVNPNGSPTEFVFQYIDEAHYERNLAEARRPFAGASVAPRSGLTYAGAGTIPTPVSGLVRDLTPATAYRYRLRLVRAGEPGVFSVARPFATQEASNVFALLDHRGWEMVSPIEKDGGGIQPPGTLAGGGVFQATARGGAFTYSSADAFGPSAQGAPTGSQYLAARSSLGWTSANVTTPVLSGSYGSEPDGTPYQLFSGDLGFGLLSNGERCRGGGGTECPVANPPLAGSGAPAGYRNYYRRNPYGGFESLLTTADLSHASLGPDQFELRLVGATPDLAHVVVSSCAALTANATEVVVPGGCDPAEQNLYEWSDGGLSLINLLPGETTGTPGARIAAASGAISSDGTRVYFTAGGSLYLRDGSVTKTVLEGAESGAFAEASMDGSLAFLVDAGVLFGYSAEAEGLTALTSGTGVEGVLGISADGSKVYYADSGAIFMRVGGAVTEVASSAMESDWPPTTGTARVTADGSHLLFLSEGELTGYPNKGHAEVFLYGPPPGGSVPRLICVSCLPSGEEPQGPAQIPGFRPNGSGADAFGAYKPRVLSSDGNRVFFETTDSLVPRDNNGSKQDVYEWEAAGKGTCGRPGGCVQLISGGSDPEPSYFLDADEDGGEAFFLTAASLYLPDPGSYDIYDAREGGGFPFPETPIPCVADACQVLPEAPEDPTPGTLVPNPGNPPLKVAGGRTRHRKPKHGRRKHKKHRHSKHKKHAGHKVNHRRGHGGGGKR